MDLLPIASVWHNFWEWYDHLSNPDRIAYWSFLGSVVASPIIGFIAALVGAKYGASAAFKLGRAQQRQDLEEKQFDALVIAHYTLVHYWNNMEVFREKFFENYIESDGRLHLPLLYIPEMPIHTLAVETRFIAASNPALYRRVEVAETRYLSVLDQFLTIRQIAERHRTGLADELTTQAAKNLMDNTLDHIKRASILVDQSIGEVSELRRTLFPKRSIVEAEKVKKMKAPEASAAPQGDAQPEQ